MSSPRLSPEQIARNRALIAERGGWPADALGHCLALESDHPDWRVHYVKGGLGLYPDPGYCAVREDWQGRPHSLYAATPAELAALIEYLGDVCNVPPWAL